MPILQNQINLDDWEPVVSRCDAEGLINRFGGFSDCIIVESYIWGECYVDEELCILYPRLSAADQKARATFQRQGLNQKAVELLFIGLKSIYIKCRGDADDGIINFVAITEDGGRGDRRFLAKSSSAPEVEPIFSICARSIYWRVL